jgi:hypothetical protein
VISTGTKQVSSGGSVTLRQLAKASDFATEVVHQST